jgi:transcriptional regulator with XRE-family HTH domain
MKAPRTPGQRIRAWREAEALSLEDLSRMCDEIDADGEKVRVVTASGLSRIENDEVDWPYPKTRKAIARALSREPDQIWYPKERS